MSSATSLSLTGRYLHESQRQQLLQLLENDNLSKINRKRIQIILLADEGKSQTNICKELNCSQVTARHWIAIARTGNLEQLQDCSLGRPKIIEQEHLKRLKELVDRSPRELGYSFQRWTGYWLSKQIEKEFGVKVTQQHVNRLLKQIQTIEIKDLPFELLQENLNN